MHCLRLLLLICLGLAPAACDRAFNPTDPDAGLHGCFAGSANGKVLFRVTHEQAQPMAWFREGNAWKTTPEPLEPSDGHHWFKEDFHALDSGLRSTDGRFAVFHIREGAAFKARPEDTGYIALAMIGTRPVYKVVCPA